MSTTEDRDTQVYELCYLVLPSIPEDKLADTVDSLKKIVTNAGGSEIGSEAPFMHKLAYAMSKTVGASKYVVNEAYIGWTKFEVEPSAIADIRTAVEKMDEIIRFLLIKAPRETTFTFAQARAAMEEENMPEEAPVAEVAPEEPKQEVSAEPLPEVEQVVE